MKKFKNIIASALAIAAIAAFTAIPASAASQRGELGEIIYYNVELRKPILWDGVKGCSNFTFHVDYDWIQSGVNGSSYVRMIANDWGFSDSKTARVAKGTNYANTGDLEAKGYRDSVKSWHNGSICYKGTNNLMMELPSEVNLSV